MEQRPVDRRQRHRQDTIAEILDVAASIMAEQGAGGLSLGEVARRMGIRPPSLYGYFDSKNALYDALFQRGWSTLNAVMRPRVEGLDSAVNVTSHVLDSMRTFVRWAVENPAYAQLMFWRPVPGYQPSQAAYAPALESMEAVVTMVATLRDRGVLRADVDVTEAATACTVLVSGVISQQLANAPHESFDKGTFTRLLPQLMASYLAGYAPDGGNHDRTGKPARGRRGGAADAPARGGGGGDRAVRGAAGVAARSRRR